MSGAVVAACACAVMLLSAAAEAADGRTGCRLGDAVAVEGCPAIHSPTPENGITAHRGNSFAAPENSLRAFTSGNDAGADWIETDVRTTSDGRLVLMHNGTTRAYCSVDMAVCDSTYDELRKLDLAEKFRARHGLSTAQCPRQEIVLLEDALDLILRERKARLSIQPKSDCVDQVVELVRRKGAVRWVGFNDGSLEKMSRVKELEPSVTVFWDRGRSDVDEDISTARRHGFEWIVLNCNEATAEKVEKLHGAGFRVGVWTVNDLDGMRRFLDMGVNRIYTDNPEALKRLLQARAEGR